MKVPENFNPENEENDIQDVAETDHQEAQPDLQPEPATIPELESQPGEGELEVPEDEGLPLAESAEVPETEPVEGLTPEEGLAVEEEVKESKVRRFFRRLIRWTVGILIVFGLGLIAGIYGFYRPTVKDAEASIQQLKGELSVKEDEILDLQGQITDLKDQIAGLKPLEETNMELLAAQANFRLHVATLGARLDVANAMLSLKSNDIAQTRVILNDTGETLNTIGDLLEPGQREIVVAMGQRLDLVLSELDDDPYAAESDLDVLSTNLLQLEDELFSE